MENNWPKNIGLMSLYIKVLSTQLRVLNSTIAEAGKESSLPKGRGFESIPFTCLCYKQCTIIKLWHVMTSEFVIWWKIMYLQNRYWRKSRSKTRNRRCPGVDLNRNFNFKWGGRICKFLSFQFFIHYKDRQRWVSEGATDTYQAL